MSFTNPALLAGAALFTVPLVIHLLNRQRHKKRPWAAMEFLLRAYQKQRNRLRNENLLLLLLRCLVPVLLALAVARPLLNSAAGLLSGGGLVHHVLVVDGSYSMAVHPDGAPSPFDRARTMVGRLVDRFEQNPNRTDKVTLVLAGVRPRFLVRGDLDLGTLRNQWLGMQRPEHGAGDLTTAMQQVAEAVESSGDSDVQVYVFTDLQQRALGKAWSEPGKAQGPELADTLRDQFERLQKRAGTQLHCIDVGPLAEQHTGGVTDNTQITALRIEQPCAVLRTPVTVVATLKNRGLGAARCEVTLEIDGGEPTRRVVEVPAGTEAEAEFQVTFREPGRRRLRASLQSDALEVDDERFATLEVRDRVRVLLVDGAADGDPARAYAWVWQRILDPDPAALPTFAVEARPPLALLGGQVSPKNYDVTVLADVERINQRAATALGEALQAGRGVLVAFGEQADVESYNLHLYAAGAGPMPMRLLPATGGQVGSSTARAPVLAMPEHPLFREFEEEIYREVFQAIPVWRWLPLAPGSLDPAAQVPARLDDGDQSPLLVTKAFGEGKAVFLTSAIASEFRPDRWNRLDDPMVAFPLLHGLVKWLALPASDPFAATVGAELSCSLPARPENLELQRPERDGGGKIPLAEDAEALPGGRFRLPPYTDTTVAGFYVFDLQLDREAGKEPLSLPFAVNVDPEEGELRYPAHDEARQALGLPRILTTLPATVTADDGADRSDLGPTLLLATLLFVLGEAALARFVSARRS